MNPPPPVLFPQPETCEAMEGSTACPTPLCYHLEDDELLPGLRSLSLSFPIELRREKPAHLSVLRNPSMIREEYSLVLSATGIRLEAQGPEGAYRGMQTLMQILQNSSGQNLPCLRIKDRPALKRRGFMLDVSRCKVPRMNELFSLIDLLSLLKFNELQLYVEHTFAFAKHST
ncbi:MAG: glycoside hydrolase family 20 zincin-like fold domain-containing protein, partial [Verrucomicrobiota bacterium]|nr:glycoside hydrolase family 20 zincin-like fold domain-containing protein [Verrucomicrobiota bacterium]